MPNATVPTLTYISADLSPSRQHSDLLGQEITERMRNRYEDLFIDANTCVTKYAGGGIDCNMAVSAMYQ